MLPIVGSVPNHAPCRRKKTSVRIPQTPPQSPVTTTVRNGNAVGRRRGIVSTKTPGKTPQKKNLFKNAANQPLDRCHRASGSNSAAAPGKK